MNMSRNKQENKKDNQKKGGEGMGRKSFQMKWAFLPDLEVQSWLVSCPSKDLAEREIYLE